MYEMKRRITLDELCDGLPECFKKFMTYVRELAFDARPDYQYLREMFDDAYDKQQFQRQNKFDWETGME